MMEFILLMVSLYTLEDVSPEYTCNTCRLR
jgi:hypothetical protein